MKKGTSCREFYACFYSGTAYAQRYNYACPDNLIYDVKIKGCNYPTLAVCVEQGALEVAVNNKPDQPPPTTTSSTTAKPTTTTSSTPSSTNKPSATTTASVATTTATSASVDTNGATDESNACSNGLFCVFISVTFLLNLFIFSSN